MTKPTTPAGASAAFSRQLGQALHERLQLAARPLVQAQAGQLLIAAGQPVQRLPLLVSGQVHAVMHARAATGRQIVPVRFGPGEIVMLSYLFGDEPSTVDMVAAEPTALRWLQTSDIEAALLAEPALAVLLIRFLVQRLRDVQARERAWVEPSVPLRLAAALVRMATDLPEIDGARTVVATHEVLARRAGVSRPKASQALKTFEREGWLQQGRGQVRIVDWDALQSLVG
ncbi:MAG: Crp/Fnr family transcriptional regulator [Ottowia sp.]|nr:Crp/Fnr family transcriptional regulator [Rhodoferax sp.]MCB2035879.1 Crp/Fnr family transcriptional regulator [Ottowia sp.]MCB2071867.1 Crp/Fnr family transcriptional regulator [Ottowia sp.]